MCHHSSKNKVEEVVFLGVIFQSKLWGKIYQRVHWRKFSYILFQRISCYQGRAGEDLVCREKVPNSIYSISKKGLTAINMSNAWTAIYATFDVSYSPIIVWFQRVRKSWHFKNNLISQEAYDFVGICFTNKIISSSKEI